jgi:2-oxoglutarate ferredoxin oxidoreductase subunit gamma
VLAPDILVALSTEAFVKYSPDLKDGGIAIIDSDLVKAGEIKQEIRVFRVPAAATAREVLKNALVTNVIMLGAFTAISQVVSPDAMRKAIAKAFPRFVELNRRAFDEGMRLGEEASKQEKR